MPPLSNNRRQEQENSSHDDTDHDAVIAETAATIASLLQGDGGDCKNKQHFYQDDNSRRPATTTALSSSSSSSSTSPFLRFFSSPTEAPYVECTHPHGFTNPFLTCTTSKSTHTRTPAEINDQDLNLYLGQRWITTDHPWLHDFLVVFHQWCCAWWEDRWLLFLRRYILVDAVLRFVLITVGWKLLYYPIHKRILGRRTGLHPDVSKECHALSTVMYLGHFVLHSVQRIRFGLTLMVAARPAPPKHKVEVLPDNRGLWVHAAAAAPNTTTTTLIWFHAGAYLSGSPHGNLGLADAIVERMGGQCNVFLPTYRLAPEHSMADVMEDVHKAYEWVTKERTSDRILVGGWSAGAALAMRLLQELSKNINNNKHPVDGAVLGSPFCRYAYPSEDSSMVQYAKHDWLVTQGVARVSRATLQLDTFWGGDPDRHSPLCHFAMEQSSKLPPMCVLVSEHEAVYDETCELIRLTRKAGAVVTVAQWRYMPHGWYMFDSLMPEGARAVQYMCDWMKTNVTEKSKRD